MLFDKDFTENLPIIFCCKKADYSYFACSKQYANLMGYSSPKDLVGQTDFHLRLSKTKNKDAFGLKTPVVGKKLVDEVWFRGRFYKVSRSQAQGSYVFYLIEDNTLAHKLAQELEANKEAREVLLDVIACMPGNVYWLDQGGRFQGCNDNVLKMLGLHSRDEFKGLTHSDTARLMDWESGQAESFRNDDLQVLRTGKGKVDVEEPSITNADGSEIIYLTSRVPLQRDKKTVGVVGISIDITARKKAEAALRKAKEEAEAANQAKSEFLAMMTHELRTPLNVVMGMTQIMLDETCSAEERKTYLESIFRSGNSLLGLINDILDFGKGQSGKLEMVPMAFRLDDLLSQLKNEFSVKAKEIGINYIVKRDKSIPEYIKADPKRLRQIMYNLSDNALKFTEKGSVHLIVKQILAKKKKHIGLRVQVKDSGIGIPKDKLDTVFEGFTQIHSEKHNEYTRKQGGVGLGLSIVRQLIEKMGAKIHVNSIPEKGTTFTCEFEIALPLKKEIIEAKKKEALPTIQSKKSIRPSRILLVEDNELNQKVAIHLLKRFNAKVSVAKDGKQALKKLSNGYDLVFMDMSLPDMSGPEIVEKFRQKESKKNRQPIIALSANVHLEDQKKCLDVGMDGFMTKPIMINELHDLLVEYVGYED